MVRCVLVKEPAAASFVSGLFQAFSLEEFLAIPSGCNISIQTLIVVRRERLEPVYR